MDRKKWKSLIKRNCIIVGTYNKAFEPIIETLADILTRRDETQAEFEESGGRPIVKHTNKAGAENLEQNPALRLINDLNRDALQYWRDLGLTPAGLKKINDEAMKKEQGSALDRILSDLEG